MFTELMSAEPISDGIIQFWIQEKDGINYCVLLTRKGFLYSAHVYLLQKYKTIPVYQCMLFDKAQNLIIDFY